MEIVKEQLRKKVARSGNSGAVWVPKSWLGEEILITRLEKKLSFEEEIIQLLSPYLKNIQGIYIYGSYARNEETKDSDIDILVVSDKKFNLKIKNFDINVIESSKIRTEVKNNIFLYSAIKEAKPVINNQLLEELKKISLTQTSFILWFKDSTKSSIKSTKEFIELDKLEGKLIKSASIIYSLMLRLRGLFLIKCILKNKNFSNLEFKNYLLKTISNKEFQRTYSVYRSIRDNKTIKGIKVEIKTAEALLELLKKELNGK